MNLYEMFREHSGRQIDKWEHYFPIYEKYFAKFRGEDIRVLEIGIDHGGSLQLWQRYFGSRAEIIGVDIRPTTMFVEGRIRTLCMDQTDIALADYGPFDIVIDDGSHVLSHQEQTFANLWPRTRGVYLIEDCHGCFPAMTPRPPLVYEYPWVIVAERPRRIIKGEPMRELRQDETDARALYAR